MSRLGKRSVPITLLVLAIVTMVVSIIGLIASLILNSFVFDKFDAYGEVPIPGSASLELPAGEVNIAFHTVTIGSTGGGLPVPQIRMSIDPPPGTADPVVTENIGGTTTVNNDVRRRIWVAQIPEAGTYTVTTHGEVGPFIEPRLAFGHGSTTGWVPWVFGVLLGIAVLDLVIALIWLTFGGRGSPVPEFEGFEDLRDADGFPDAEDAEDLAWDPERAPPLLRSYEPTDHGIRIEQLKDIAALRDSGALTEDEFEAEKRRILDGG